MVNGDFSEWGPRRIDDHGRRISKLEAHSEMITYRVEQTEANHREAMKTINEFAGETRASFGSVHEDIKSQFREIQKDMTVLAGAVSQGQGVATAVKYLLPMVTAVAASAVTFFSVGGGGP